MQSAIGFGSIAGLFVGSILADNRTFLTNMRAMYIVLAAVLTLWAVAFILSMPGTLITIGFVAVVTFLTSAALIAPSPAIEKALVQANPDQSALTLAMNTSVIYLGQGIGAGLGGLVVGSLGFGMLGYVGGGVALLAVVTAFVFRDSGTSAD